MWAFPARRASQLPLASSDCSSSLCKKKNKREEITKSATFPRKFGVLFHVTSPYSLRFSKCAIIIIRIAVSLVPGRRFSFGRRARKEQADSFMAKRRGHAFVAFNGMANSGQEICAYQAPSSARYKSTQEILSKIALRARACTIRWFNRNYLHCH